MRIAGVVMLAAPLTRLDDVIVEQYEFLSRLPVPGATAEMIDDMKARRDKRPSTGLAGRGRHHRSGAGGRSRERPASARHAGLRLARHRSLRPGRGAARAAGPWAALLAFGGRDFQVPIAEKALWEARLRGRPRTTLIDDPSLNHLLIAGDGPMSPAEYQRPGRVSQTLIDRLSAWILEGPR